MSNTHIRAISASELDQFVAAGQHSLGEAGFAKYIRELWERGSSSPERTFVAEQDGQFIGRILYRGQGEEVNFTGLSLPWDGDYLFIGQQLFHESLSQLQQDGVHVLEAYITSAWSYHHQAQNLMEQLGLTLVQTKLRYIWQQPLETITPSSRLVFKTLTDIGEEAFTDLIRRATEGTLDRLDQLQIAEMGAEQHAHLYFTLLKSEFEFIPHWWLAAYTPEGEAVGHVVGVPFNSHRHEGSIGYIGVVPEQRGKGYVDELLRQSMSVMLQDGMQAFVCDTDSPNIPMQRSFERNGYSQTDTTWVYRATLETLLA
jgi:RimJ/RimL family protein N-acetyltransferase